MKKYLIGVLSAAALLTAALLVVFTGGNKKATEVYADHTHCICGGSTAIGDHTAHTAVTWTEWTSTTSLPTVNNIPAGETEGYFYLTGDVTISAAWNPGNAKADCGGKKLAVCLNGYNINKTGGSRATTFLSSYTTATGSIQVSNFTLTLTDCNETPGHFTRKAASTDSGGLIWVGANSSGAGVNDTVNIFNIPVDYDYSGDGKSSASGGAFMMTSNSVLNLYDVTISGTKSSASGSAIYAGDTATVNLYDSVIENCYTSADGGTVCITSKSTVNLYGSVIRNNQAKTGAGVKLLDNAVLNMHDSSLDSNVAKDDTGAWGQGGNVVLYSSSSLNMWNSSLKDGTVYAGTGGNMEIQTSGTVNLYEGTVIDGGTTVNVNNGANIAMGNSKATNATLNIYDGVEIKNGASGNIAGNFQFCYGTINMYGGLIKGGTNKGNANADTANIHMYGQNCTFNMYGGTIEGRFYVRSGHLNVSGDSVIYANDNGTKYGLTLANSYANSATDYATCDDYKFTDLEEGAKIYLAGLSLNGNKSTVLGFNSSATNYTNNKNNVLQTGVDYSIKQFFESNAFTICVTDEDGDGIADSLKWYSATGDFAHAHCVCGGTLEDGKTYGSGDYAVTHHCVDVVWTKLTVTNGAANRPQTTGYYYLPEDAILNGGSGSAYGQTIGICFNGHVGTQQNIRLYQTNDDSKAASNFTLTDCVGTGGIYGDNAGTTANTNQGCFIWTGGTRATKISIYAGTYDYSDWIYTGGSGALVCLQGQNSEFRQFGGELIGINENQTCTAGNVHLGAAGSKFLMYGGKLTDGHGNPSGGNLNAAEASCTVYIAGGTISGGTRNKITTADGYGGNILSGGTFIMDGGTITGGANTCGGNIWITNGTFTMNGGEILNGRAYQTGNNTDIFAGNVGVNNTKVFTMNGGKIAGGSSTKNGGNVRTNGKFIMNGGEISGGTSSSGGNVFANIGHADTVDGIFEMNGGLIKDGTATSSGGNVAVNGASTYLNGTFIMNGGTIQDGVANVCGGNVSNSGTMTLLKGTITGGEALGTNGTGGNIYMEGLTTRTYQPTLTVSGGTVSNGVTTRGGGNLYVNGPKEVLVTISGGEFYGGEMLASDYSIPNIGMNGGSLTITGGTFTKNRKIDKNSNAIWFSANAKGASISGGYIDQIWSNSDNGLKSFVSGGYWFTKPGTSYLAAGMGAVDLVPTVTKTVGTDPITYLYKVAPAVTATVQSVAEGSAASVATVTGGGLKEKNVAFTLSAPAESNGYTFVKWCIGSENGTVVGNTPECTVTGGISANTTFVAVYTFGATTVRYEINGTVFTFKTASGTTDETVTKAGTIAIGTEITISYEGTEPFICWKNASNKIITRDAAYTFTIYTDTVLTAETEDAASGETEIFFLNDKSQVLATRKTSTALTEADLPDIPVRVGRTGGEWSKTLDEINAAIADTAVKSFEVKATGYTVVENLYNEIVGATVPTIVMDIMEVTDQGNGTNFTVSFGATRAVPSGYTLVEQGMLFGANTMYDSKAAADAGLVYGGTKVVKYVSNGLLPNDLTMLNIKNVTEGKTTYAKGYLVYLKDGETTPTVIYTELATGTVSGVTLGR